MNINILLNDKLVTVSSAQRTVLEIYSSRDWRIHTQTFPDLKICKLDSSALTNCVDVNCPVFPIFQEKKGANETINSTRQRAGVRAPATAAACTSFPSRYN